jgi:hypothetical protein
MVTAEAVRQPGHLFVSSDAKTTLADLRLKLTELGKR